MLFGGSFKAFRLFRNDRKKIKYHKKALKNLLKKNK